jgi:hypothetical protein
MSELRCVVVRLRPGSLERTRAWAAELRRRADEVISSLKEEGVLIECAFLFPTPDADHLIYFMKAVNMVEAQRVGAQSTHDIDTHHRAFKRDTWASVEPLEMLIHFDRTDP